MGRLLRFLPHPHTTFEVTCRTLQGRRLLKPCKELNTLILGVIGRALVLYPGIRLHLFTVLSNHMHLLLTTPDSKTLSRFMGFVNSNIAREVGRLYGWREKFWGRRYRAIPVLDDEALLGRVHYILSHGVKEGLVRRPGDWPGVQCVQALCEGRPLVGLWFDRSQAYEARRHGEEPSSMLYATAYEVLLSPLPCFANDSPDEKSLQEAWANTRTLARDLVEQIEEQQEQSGLGALGVQEIMRQDPTERPEKTKRSPAPWCHTTERERWIAYRQAYRAFVTVFRESASRLCRMLMPTGFPDHCFLPATGYHSTIEEGWGHLSFEAPL